MLGTDIAFAARDVVWVEPSVNHSSVADAVGCMRPLPGARAKVVDPSPILLLVFDAHSDHVLWEGEWDLLDVPPSREIDVRSSSRADFVVIRD